MLPTDYLSIKGRYQNLRFSSPNACSAFPNSICIPIGAGFNCECKVGFIRDDDQLCTLCSTNFIPLGILLNHDFFENIEYFMLYNL